MVHDSNFNRQPFKKIVVVVVIIVVIIIVVVVIIIIIARSPPQTGIKFGLYFMVIIL